MSDAWMRCYPGSMVAQQIDPNTPNTARIYDYYLNGKDNYPADRVAARLMMEAAPESVRAVRENRRFLVEAVHYLAAQAGIRQFLDIGSGLPTQRNVHEVAQAAAPDSRVVYADHDPVVLAHGSALLATNQRTAFVRAGLQEPQSILEHPGLTALIDFDKPVAVLLVAILHFFPDEADPAGIIAGLRAAMAPGSFLVISHVLKHPSTRKIQKIMQESGAPPWFPRTHEEIGRWFEGFDLVDPGLTSVDRWRPTSPGPDVVPISAGAADAGGEPLWCEGGVARLPAVRAR